MYLGDCLEVMKGLDDKSVDLVLADLPYGTTNCHWDETIPFDVLWQQYNRIAKDNAAIVIFGSEPFSSNLRISNLSNYRYDWIWSKNVPTGFALVKKQPMRAHETISVFYRSQPTYNPQMVDSKITDRKLGTKNSRSRKASDHISGLDVTRQSYELREKVYPRSIVEFNVPPRAKGTLHPTQKPVDLLGFLIRTYTNEGDIVLDNTMGSGSTGVACKSTGRHFIGIEKEPKYFEIAKTRIESA